LHKALVSCENAISYPEISILEPVSGSNLEISAAPLQAREIAGYEYDIGENGSEPLTKMTKAQDIKAFPSFLRLLQRLHLI